MQCYAKVGTKMMSNRLMRLSVAGGIAQFTQIHSEDNFYPVIDLHQQAIDKLVADMDRLWQRFTNQPDPELIVWNGEIYHGWQEHKKHQQKWMGDLFTPAGLGIVFRRGAHATNAS
jgi:hypothetical protein